jgi:methyl-accepting chemotaxis protein
MALPSEYRLTFDIIGVSPEVNEVRRKVWVLLEPHLGAALDEHFRDTLVVAPSVREAVTTNAAAYKDSIISGTKRLFTRPFHDDWVTDAKQRIETEIALGFDMRARMDIDNTILGTLNRIISRTWLSRQTSLRLLDEAARIFSLDVAVAQTLHYAAKVGRARERNLKLEQTIRAFGTIVEQIRGTAGHAVASLSESAGELNRLTNTASMQSQKAAAAADNTATNASNMAAAAHELTNSIASIHDQATQSAEMARRAAAQGDQTNLIIKSLADTVAKIAPVADFISRIAAQTNLLALNATIEAARAGEAGRGFAVVASEVKSLAAQTGKATEDISREIALIEEAMRRSVEKIKTGNETIAYIAEIAEQVAGAVSEQAETTNGIAKGAAQAAANAVTVAEALKAIELTIQRTQESARAGLGSTERIKTDSARIGMAMDELFDMAKDVQLTTLYPLGKERQN